MSETRVEIQGAAIGAAVGALFGSVWLILPFPFGLFALLSFVAFGGFAGVAMLGGGTHG